MDQPKIEFSARASLVAYGVRFQQMGIWATVSAQVKIKQKVRDHTALWSYSVLVLTLTDAIDPLGQSPSGPLSLRLKNSRRRHLLPYDR